MILTALTACDNVSWGGVELRLETPSTVATDTARPDTAVGEDEPPPLDIGPVLFTASRSGDTVRLVPAAVMEEDGLRSLPRDEEIPDFAARFRSERLAAGSRFVLFTGGKRAGTVYAGEGGTVDSAYCAPRPTVSGRVELRPEAMGVDRFLALPADPGDRYAHSELDQVASDRSQRVASLDMAAALFVTREIQWPPSILEARADVQVFRPAGSASEIIAATFLYGDSLQVGPAPDNAYSLFFLGEATNGGYEPTYVRYREVGVDGKGAARFIDHLDWDRDGAPDVLLDVYGLEHRWVEALERTPAGGWEETFREACGVERSAGTVEETEGPAGAPESAGAGGGAGDPGP